MDGYADSQSGELDDETQLSALQYARSCGFCSDFMLENPLTTRALSVLPLTTEHDLDDPRGAPKVTDLYPTDLFIERLEISNDVALILQKALVPEHNRVPFQDVPDVVPRKKLTVEIPLLLSDHELDVQRFCQSRRLSLADVRLPLEHVDIERDEGMEWAQHCLDLPDEMIKRIGTERLEVPRDVIALLKGLMYDPEVVNHENFDMPDQTCTKVSRTGERYSKLTDMK